MDENKNLNTNLPNGFDSVSSTSSNQEKSDINGESYSNNITEPNISLDSAAESDEDLKTSAPKATEKDATPSTKDFLPNGTYSYSAAKGNLPDSAVNEPVNTAKEVPPLKQTPSLNDSTFESNFKNESPKAPVYVPERPKKTKKTGVKTVVISAILSIVLGILSGFCGTYIALNYKKDGINETSSNIAATPQNITNITVNETAGSIAEAVAKKAGPSVIGIRTTAAVTNFFFGTNESTEEGSGIAYTSDGYIITNYHVIESAVKSSNSKVEVFLPDNTDKSYQASIIGYNISSDLAVVKVNDVSLTPIEFTDSDKLTVGQNVIAIGNPGGLEFIGSVSTGVISGLNRTLTVGTGTTMSLIQTDAAINPGNSGGALVDTNGKLVGVNSVKLVSEGYEGMGFAIPSNTVKEICDKIISKQNEPTPYIGIQISQNYTADQLKSLGYPAGAVVVSVVEDGPAAQGGIERGDIITEYDGKTINNYNELEDAISDSKPGDSVTVKLYRAGKFYSTSINVLANNAQ